MREGVRLGIDVGDVRVGVARSDAAGILAVPVATVTVRDTADVRAEVSAMVTENRACEVIVGWPRTLAAQEGPAAHKVRLFARELAERIHPVPVRLVDERLSTTAALAGYREQGLSTRRTRTRVDQAAAAIILQSALDHERSTGVAAGELVAVEGRTEGNTP